MAEEHNLFIGQKRTQKVADEYVVKYHLVIHKYTSKVYTEWLFCYTNVYDNEGFETGICYTNV